VEQAVGVQCIRLTFAYSTNFTNFTIWCTKVIHYSYETSHHYPAR
jgi:hypothetical protein